jgi:integrase
MNGKLALNYDLSAIDNAVNLTPSSKAQYKKALVNYLTIGDIWDAAALGDYARGINRSSRSFLKAAIRLVTMGNADKLKAGATPENINTVQAMLYRLEAVTAAVQVKTVKGEKAHTWLSQAQVKAIMASCGDDLPGRRDRVVLGLLLGAGLRRDELIGLHFDCITEMPQKNGKPRSVITVMGKGDKSRVIPISSQLTGMVQDWRQAAGEGLIARSLGRKCEIGKSLSAIGLFGIVRKHGAMIGIKELDPHDLRRTYAQLGYDAGVPITQISKLLGHSSIKTTQTYLNLDLDIEVTVSDFIPLE